MCFFFCFSFHTNSKNEKKGNPIKTSFFVSFQKKESQSSIFTWNYFLIKSIISGGGLTNNLIETVSALACLAGLIHSPCTESSFNTEHGSNRLDFVHSLREYYLFSQSDPTFLFWENEKRKGQT